MNFNLNWKFIREDVPGAEAAGFDDSTWTTVSLPHSFNDVDSFRKIISHSGGDLGTFKGLVWYRKHFKLPAKLAGDKVFLEFEGMRQAGDIFLNGKPAGLYENGVTAYGLDISGAVHFGNEDNVLAVKWTTALLTWSVPAIPRLSGTLTTSIPTTAASTGMSGCTSRARSIRRCLSTTAWKAPGSYVHAANFKHCGKECRRYSRVGGEERVGRSRHGGVVGRDCRSKRAGSRQIRRQLH